MVWEEELQMELVPIYLLWENCSSNFFLLIFYKWILSVSLGWINGCYKHYLITCYFTNTNIAHSPASGLNYQESVDVNFAEGDGNKQLPVCAIVSSWSQSTSGGSSCRGPAGDFFGGKQWLPEYQSTWKTWCMSKAQVLPNFRFCSLGCILLRVASGSIQYHVWILGKVGHGGRIHKHCIFLLQFFKLQVNCQDGDGNTGLMLAICYKKQPLVDILLARWRFAWFK